MGKDVVESVSKEFGVKFFNMFKQTNRSGIS